MAAPTWQAGGGLTAVASGTTRTPTLPAHQAGDILICQAIYNGASTLSISGGWQAIFVTNAAGISTGYWWLRATSGAETNPTVTSSATASGTAVLCAQTFNIRGCIGSGTPFGPQDESAVTTGTTVSTQALTTVNNDTLVVSFVSVDDDVASSSYPPSGWTDQNDITTATGGGAHLIAISKGQAVAGSVSAASFGIASATWKSITAAFLPPAGGDAPRLLRPRGLNPLLVR